MCLVAKVLWVAAMCLVAKVLPVPICGKGIASTDPLQLGKGPRLGLTVSTMISEIVCDAFGEGVNPTRAAATARPL